MAQDVVGSIPTSRPKRVIYLKSLTYIFRYHSVVQYRTNVEMGVALYRPPPIEGVLLRSQKRPY